MQWRLTTAAADSGFAARERGREKQSLVRVSCGGIAFTAAAAEPSVRFPGINVNGNYLQMKKPNAKNKVAEDENLLTLPDNAGQEIVRSGAVLASPLLGTNQFIKFCSERALSINRERLVRLERLRLFAPIFRVRTPDQNTKPFYIPLREGNDWFAPKWAWDTTGFLHSYEVPSENDRTQEGYYSIFQINHLHIVLQGMTLQVQLDSYLGHERDGIVEWQNQGENWIKYAKQLMESLRTHEYRRTVALLCQYISNRYYPQTQGDQRTIQVSQGGSYSDNWITVLAPNWNWHEEIRNWDPQKVVGLFDLTPKKLRHAYDG